MSDQTLETIRGLTKAQQDVLGAIAVNLDTGHPPATVREFVQLGLVETYREPVRGTGKGVEQPDEEEPA